MAKTAMGTPKNGNVFGMLTLSPFVIAEMSPASKS
jgi:hypothetical protein